MIFAFLLILPLTCAVRIKVKECPITETAWMARSQTFTCESTQVYHCIRDDEGKLMETCMVAYIVQPYEEGGCPWASYSTERGSMLGGVFYSCEGNGCPQKNDPNYWSNELYKYPICLHQYIETTEVTKSTISPSGSTEITSISNNINGTVGVTISILTTAVVMIMMFIGAVLIRRCRRLNSRKKFFSREDSSAEAKTVFLDGSSKPVEMEEENEGIIHKCKLSLKDECISKGMKVNASKTSELSKAVDMDGRTVLHHACLTGNTSLVKSLLDIFKDLLFIKDNDGCTPFHLAGFSGSVKLLQMLICIGCNVRSKDNSGQTIVHHACKAGLTNLVKYLIDLDKGVLDIKDNNGMTPLRCTDKGGQTIVHHVCQAGHINFVKYLIDLDKDVLDIKDNNGMTPLRYTDKAGQTIVHHACQVGHINVVKYLIDLDKDVLDIKDNNGMTPLRCTDKDGRTIAHYACQSGDISLVNYLIYLDEDALEIKDKSGMIPIYSTDKAGQTIVHHACKSRHLNLVKLSIVIDKNVLNVRSIHGLTPFHCAGFSGSVKLVRCLIDNGCDMHSKDYTGKTIVHIACENGHIQLVEYLIGIDKDMFYMEDRNGMTPYQCKDKDGCTFLYTACSNGRVGLVKLVTEVDKDIFDGRNEDGMTPFHAAGYSGSVELVQHLLDNGCDIHSQTNYGQTIMHVAFGYGYIDLAKLLISVDRSILMINDKNGATPFHYAGLSGSVELVQYLIAEGCDVYSKDYNGQTIVHYACKKGHVDLLKHLINGNSLILYKEDNNGITPFHCAGNSGSVELVQYLIDNGCDMFSKDDTGRTIVHIVCQKRYVSLVKKLAKKDKRVLKIKDDSGWTPFHCA